MRCYICNKELVDNVTRSDQCQVHGEHIIHNGIRGKLISNRILCKECGNKYSREDSDFCKIFESFVVALKNRLISVDHGKDTPKTLRGCMFDSPTSNPDDPSRLVNAKDGVVTPVEPYHEIDGEKITVYAEKHRIDQYINVLKKQLNVKGKDIADYNVEKVTNIHNKGYLAYFFSKGNTSFNDDLKKGIVKIATEYALHCGVPREQLTEVLTITEDGRATLDCTNTTMFPFIPTSLFDSLYEDCRYFYEEGYPSHTLRLFSILCDNGTADLYCYVDLFSTFQYFVLLNGDYKGDEINETYAQRLLQTEKEKPNVSGCTPSDLNIIICEYGIDMSKCNATTYGDQLRYVQECIRKYPPQTYDLKAALKSACEMIQSIFKVALCKKKASAEQKHILDKLLESYNKQAVDQIEMLLDSLINSMTVDDILETINLFVDSINLEYYRKFGFEVNDGETTWFSIPEYCMRFLKDHEDDAKEFTNMKFSHLSCLCHNPEKLV